MASVNNSLVKTEEKKTFSTFLMGNAIKKKINETVGGANGQRFITAILSAVSTNAALQECEHSSIISAAFLGESLKLSPSPQLGQYYMVPYNKTIKLPDGTSKQIKVAQFQLGYKGYIQLAIRSGQYRDIGVMEVRDGEYLGKDKITGKPRFEFIEDDAIRENTPIVGYMSYFEYLNGFTKVLYWSKEKMLHHADEYSQAFSLDATTGKYPKVSFADYEAGKVPESEMWKYSSFWYKDFDGMAFKTMLRQLISKWGIMSIEMQEAYSKDMAELKENGDYEYIDSVEENIEDTIPGEAEIIPQEPIEKEITTQEKPKTEKKAKTTTKKEEKEDVVTSTPVVEEEIKPAEDDYEDPFAFLD